MKALISVLVALTVALGAFADSAAWTWIDGKDLPCEGRGFGPNRTLTCYDRLPHVSRNCLEVTDEQEALPVCESCTDNLCGWRFVCYNADMDSKYRQVKRVLLADIRGEKYAEGDRFPGDAQLMKRFGVSRATVLRAVGELVHDGLLCRRRGSGTYLSARRSFGRIGLLIHGSDYCEFFGPFARQVSHLCQRRGLGLLFADLSDGSTLARIRKVRSAVREWVKAGVDGVLYQPVELVADAAKINAAILDVFDKAKVPVVLIDSDVVPSPARSRYDLAAVNHFAAGCRLGEHLRKVGARRIAYLTQRDRAPCVLARELGVKTAAAGLPLAGETLYAEPDDRATVRKFLQAKRPDAIACYNDRQASLLVKTLAALGKRVPDDILVAGFDDVNFAVLSTPQLTTLHQPCQELAELAFGLLQERIRRPEAPPRETFLDAPLVIRASTLAEVADK